MSKDNPATEKQVAFLIKMGVHPETASSLSQIDADISIKDLMKQPTIHQKAFLVRRGYPIDQVKMMSKQEATEIISQYFQQNLNVKTA